MTDRFKYNTPTKIKINCPYCWGDFSDFQQINGRIQYKNKMFDDFVILPIEHARTFPHYVTHQSFAENQEIEPIQCDSCHREFTLVLAPFERGDYNKKNAISKKSKTEYDCEGRPSLLEKLVPCEINGTSFKNALLNFKYFVLINVFFLLAMIFLAIGGNYVTSITILMLLLAEVVLIVSSAWFSKKIQFYFDIENMPLLLHKNYLLSESFLVFKNRFFNFKIKKCENSRYALRVSVFSTILLLGLSLWLSWATFSKQPQITILSTIVIFGISVWFLILILSSVSALLLDSFEYSTLISTKIPLRLDPWKKEQKINIFKNLWGWTLTIFLFSSVGLEIILNLSPINDAINNAIVSDNFGSVISPLLNDPLGWFFTIFISAIILLFIVFFHSFDNNIKRRKKELLHNNKEKLQEMQVKTSVSNNDVINSVVLSNEIRMIEEIPLFFLKWSAAVILIEAIQIIIFFGSLFWY